MASFFQPPESGDPAVDACHPLSFQVYCNSALSPEERWAHWYQLILLGVGAGGLGIPILVWFTKSLLTLLGVLWRKSPPNSRARVPSAESTDSLGSLAPRLSRLRNIRSLSFIWDGAESPRRRSTKHLEIRLVDWTPASPRNKAYLVAVASENGGDGRPLQLPCLDLGALDHPPTGSTIRADVKRIRDVLAELASEVVALRLSSPIQPKLISALAEHLTASGLLVIAMASHDAKGFEEIPLGSLSGIIIENACILKDGTRRDYFRSSNLRSAMAKVSARREDHPDFFAAFIDCWETRPSAAVIRRAVNLSDHFGALLSTAQINPQPGTPATTNRSMGGFEYLRRSDAMELHKAWCYEERQLYIPTSSTDTAHDVAILPVADFENLLPGVQQLLQPHALPNDLSNSEGQDTAPVIAPFDYASNISTKSSIWDRSPEGKFLSPRGCFPLTTFPSLANHDAIARAQLSLKKLEMLHSVKGLELHRIISKLEGIRSNGPSSFLLNSLITGLTAGIISVSIGLDSGFRDPVGGSHFWGVSCTEGDGSDLQVHIFLSQKTPSDFNTVLHTWLAHHAVPREDRYNRELAAEKADGSDGQLPKSIIAAIEQATHSELLLLLERIHVEGLKSRFRGPIMSKCRDMLLEDAAKRSWRRMHSNDWLEGSVTMKDVIHHRLQHFASRGAKLLPTVTNLVQLFNMMEEKIQDCLYRGDRRSLNTMIDILCKSYDPLESREKQLAVDINADLMSLIFFCVLRRAALEEIYIETTDRCPFFLSQPDQAAVFAELWTLGSQCEIYLGIRPRDLGAILYDTYRAHLEQFPPPTKLESGILTMYSNAEDKNPQRSSNTTGDGKTPAASLRNLLLYWRGRFLDFGALSIFCLPATLDVSLLTFFGRGLFITAFMPPEQIRASTYAVLISLLQSAGVTGWVASIGSYYLPHYAYENMIYAHIQRLSGGAVLTVLIALGGLVGYAVQGEPIPGLVFAGYTITISTYLNILGIMSTMHSKGSPLTSGRVILWRTIPFLFLSPILSSFINNHDLEIYLPISFGFLLLLLIQYRRLCREWCTWVSRIPTITEQSILDWYGSKGSGSSSSIGRNVPVLSASDRKAAFRAFGEAVDLVRGRSLNTLVNRRVNHPLVAQVARGMPYIDWLLKKDFSDSSPPEAFSPSWFPTLTEAVKNQRQMSRGLKEHNIFILFRAARYDIAQNLGLFLIALLDRWITIVMPIDKQMNLYHEPRSRYGMCMCIIYFCSSVMALDATLQKHWGHRFKASKEKLRDFSHAKEVAQKWESIRRYVFCQALFELATKLLFIFGLTSMILWFLVDNHQTIIIYFAYINGYTCVLLFQLNRGFTTDIVAYLVSIFTSAAIGFITGIVLHLLPWTKSIIYIDIIAMNTAAILAAVSTFIWSWNDFNKPFRDSNSAEEASGDDTILRQPRATQNCDLFEDKLSGSTWTSLATTKTLATRNTAIPSLISQTLSSAATHRPSPSTNTAMDMWTSNKIHLTITSSEVFRQFGLQDCCSISKIDSNRELHVILGLLPEKETEDTAFHLLVARIASEAILYHVTRAYLNQSHAMALYVEHYLCANGEKIPRRVELEIGHAKPIYVGTMRRNINMQLLKHLALNVNVDVDWDNLPDASRQAIVARVTGTPMTMDTTLVRWISDTRIDLQTTNFEVNFCLYLDRILQDKAETFLDDGSSTVVDDELAEAMQADNVYKPSLWVTLTSSLASIPLATVKWIAIVTGAGSDIEREIWYSLRQVYFGPALRRIIFAIWQVCWILKNFLLRVFLVSRRHDLVKIARLARQGTSRSIVKNSIVAELPRRTITGFASIHDHPGATLLEIYDGLHSTQPINIESPCQAVYNAQFQLQSKVERGTGPSITTTYQYKDSVRRWPFSKLVADGHKQTVCYYDHYGRVTHGTLTFGANSVAFKYYYKSTPKGSYDILRADYHSMARGSDRNISVHWGVPRTTEQLEAYDWVPSERVSLVIRTIDGKEYTTVYEYTHPRDPIMTTTLGSGANATVVALVPQVFKEEPQFLVRPTNLAFDSDDLLIHHSVSQLRFMRRLGARSESRAMNLWPALQNFFWLSWRGRTVYRRVPTWHIRTELWNSWLKSGTLDAVSACWVDEMILREEPLLKKYWKYRGQGQLKKAKLALEVNLDQIVSVIEIEHDVSELCLLLIRPSDLYSMGSAKDATEMTTRPDDSFKDTPDRISVIFNDIGCWPLAPGGVSNCRRDLVNGHSTIRNHVLAECANDYGIPRFQIEKSVQSMKLLPLWGLDGNTAHHGVIDNYLQSQVDEKILDTDIKRDIVGVFIPLLKTFVKGARSRRYSRQSLIECSNAIMGMSQYFEFKDYNITWDSREVQRGWVEAWLTPYNDPNVLDPSQYFELERPSMEDFRDAMAIFKSYFFIFSVKVPDDCPRVFQSTHHGISSLFGLVLKYSRGTTFGIWDHAILWRESCLNVSPAQCLLSIPVQSMVLAGVGLASRLAYLHADVIMPCTSLFNPIWEEDLGTDSGRMASRKEYVRKIDPVVNGISNIDAFTPPKTIRTTSPTVVMLSNIQMIKGIKTAILAADVIVNKYGFKDYQLMIYGAKDRQPAYCMEMARLIVECNLTDHVKLAGFGSPKEVLQDAWLFVNSSISEGLPLAIGEAALAGVPIVATEVGATALVLTDPDNATQRYGEVVAPNNPLALARAQLSILSMSGPWTKFTSDETSVTLPDEMTEADVGWITQRMYDKVADRRKLGMFSRNVVLESFHGKRYLREHEQMYWVQWNMAKMRKSFGQGAEARPDGTREEADQEPRAMQEVGSMMDYSHRFSHPEKRFSEWRDLLGRYQSDVRPLSQISRGPSPLISPRVSVSGVSQ